MCMCVTAFPRCTCNHSQGCAFIYITNLYILVYSFERKGTLKSDDVFHLFTSRLYHDLCSKHMERMY
jgi:hypothetical protein